jgi:periplasmic divalent cation tolerance protein
MSATPQTELFERPPKVSKAMSEKTLVLITTKSEEEALRISRALLEARLVACATLVGQVRSLYRWQGAICDEQEVLLLCKTQRHLFDQLSQAVKTLHSYEVPEIVALEMNQGWAPYFLWIENETKQQ